MIRKVRASCGDKLCMPSNATDWNVQRCEVFDDFAQECGMVLQGKPVGPWLSLCRDTRVQGYNGSNRLRFESHGTEPGPARTGELLERKGPSIRWNRHRKLLNICPFWATISQKWPIIEKDFQ